MDKRAILLRENIVIIIKLINLVKPIEKREYFLRKIIEFFIGKEFDSLKFHNFYGNAFGKNLINYHTRLVMDICREYSFPTLNEHAEKVKNLLLFPFNFTFLISSQPKEYGHIIGIDARKGINDYFSKRIVSDEYFMSYNRLLNDFYNWNK